MPYAKKKEHSSDNENPRNIKSRMAVRKRMKEVMKRREPRYKATSFGVRFIGLSLLNKLEIHLRTLT